MITFGFGGRLATGTSEPALACGVLAGETAGECRAPVPLLHTQP